MVTCMDTGPALVRRLWDKWAEDLSAEFGVPITWCLLGFEIPAKDGSRIEHVWNPEEVRTILRGRR
jgi:hypothetical protein